MASPKVEVIISAKDQASGVLRNIDSAAKSLQGGFGSLISTGMRLGPAFAAVAGAGALGMLVKSTIDYEDHLNDLSKTSRLTVETLAGIGHVARQSGADLDGTVSSIDKLAKEMGKNSEKFRALGITAKDPLQAFGQLADVLNQIEDPQQRAAVAAEALGKGWESAAPLLSEGSKAIEEMVRQGKELSGVTTESAKRADEFNDRWEKFKTLGGGLVTRVLSPMVDMVNKLGGALEKELDAKPGSIIHWMRTQGGGANIKSGQQILDAMAAGKTPAAGKPTAGGIAGFLGGAGKKAKDAPGFAFGMPNLDKEMEAFEKTARAFRGANDPLRDLIASYDEAYSVFEQTRTPLEKLEAQYKRLNDLQERGALDQETYGRAVLQAQSDFDDAVNKSGKVLDQFAENAAKNAQNAFADFLFDPFEGGLSGMVNGFANAMRRMVAEAAAADLTKYLFGGVAGGKGSGVLGGLFNGAIGSLFGGGAAQAPAPVSTALTRMLPSFAVGSDFVPRDMIAKIHRGERIVPASENRSGSGISVVNHFTVGGNVDARSQAQIAQAAGVAIQRALRRNG